MGYRDAATIERAVQSVVEQRAAEPFEVVVVTSGDDESAALVGRSFHDLHVVASPTRLLPGGARNAGVSATTGSVIAFLAADCVAEPGWIAHRVEAHENGWAAVASAVTNGERTSPAAWAFHFDLYSGRLATRAAGPVSYPDPAGHGLSYTRDLLERLGPFDETLRIGEDTDMARRMREAGVVARFEPTVRTSHFGPRTTAALVHERARRAADVAALDPAAIPPTVRAALGMWASRVRATFQSAWKGAGPDRRWVIVATPWIALGCAAGVVGAWRIGRQR